LAPAASSSSWLPRGFPRYHEPAPPTCPTPQTGGHRPPSSRSGRG
jgi:hypothetical protein